ncbi:MAG: aspartate dehydrogenase domain-containing protein [Clostridia bacterium]
MKKVVVLGCGRLGKIIASAIHAGVVEGVTLHAILCREPDKHAEFAKEMGCMISNSLDEVMQAKPDYVVEAGTKEAVIEHTENVLRKGADIILLSMGVFVDENYYNHIKNVAIETNQRVHLASGVVGGFDIMSTAMLMGELKSTFETRRKPRNEGNAPTEFSGTAEELYSHFPNNLNVAIAVALGTNGPKNTFANLVKIEGDENSSFSTTLEGEFGKSYIYTELNGKGPAMAGWSAVAMLQRLTQPISF